VSAWGQESATEPKPEASPSQSQPQTEEKHILGIVPNYKTVPELSGPFVPISTKTKFKLATQDSFDPFEWVVAGMFAGFAQLGDQYHEFGQGTVGYAKRYGGAFADQLISNYVTEAILPSLLHQDCRYFRLGEGKAWKRTRYALTRVFVTRSDSGHWVFNTSEIAGNAMSASLSNIYYPDSQRTVGNTTQKWGVSIGSDAGFNVLKEFWPDLRKKIFKQ
jgi:hypothetical protein